MFFRVELYGNIFRYRDEVKNKNAIG